MKATSALRKVTLGVWVVLFVVVVGSGCSGVVPGLLNEGRPLPLPLPLPITSDEDVFSFFEFVVSGVAAILTGQDLALGSP